MEGKNGRQELLRVDDDVEADKNGTKFKDDLHRGTRAGKKVQAAKQAKNKAFNVNIRQQNDFSTRNMTGRLLRTLAKECTVDYQSKKGDKRRVQIVDSEAEGNNKHSNSISTNKKHNHLYNKQSGIDGPQTLSERTSLRTNGQLRGTRGEKRIKTQQSFEKVAMLLSALSKECSN